MNNNTLNTEEKKICFDAFIEEYKEKSLKEKQRLIIEDLKEIIALFQKVNNLSNIEPELLVNREIIDVNNENYTEDDFAEAVYVYLNMSKDVIANFLLPIIGEE